MTKYRHIDARACRALWVAVLDAMLADLNSPRDTEARQIAERWFARGESMLTVAALAGLDGRLIRERYRAGRFGQVIKAGSKKNAPI